MTSSAKVEIQRGLREFLKLVLAPPSLLFFALVITTPLWLDACVELLLRSSLWLPGGWALYLITATEAACVAGGLVLIVVRAAQVMPFVKAARRLRQAGDMAKYEEVRAQWRAAWVRIHRPMWTLMIAMALVPPVIVATILASDPPPFAVRDHGKLRFATREEAIVHLVAMIHRDGLSPKRR